MDSNAGKTSLEQDENGVAGITGNAVAFFTVLAILVYPVGLLIFAAQLWTAYAYPLTISLNAAALAPTAETAFKVFHSIFWFFGALFCVLVVRSLMIGSSTFGESYGGKIGLLIFVLLTPLTTPTPYISSAFGPYYIYTWRGMVLYGLFLVFVFIAGYVSRSVRDESEWWSSRLKQLPAYLFTILAATCVSGAQDPALPSIQLGDEQREVSLLSHTEGYWYVFDAQGDLSAIPDDEAGKVRYLKGENVRESSD